MLGLTRTCKVNDPTHSRLVLRLADGERIEIEVFKLVGTRVRLGVQAPASVVVMRAELEAEWNERRLAAAEEQAERLAPGP